MQSVGKLTSHGSPRMAVLFLLFSAGCAGSPRGATPVAPSAPSADGGRRDRFAEHAVAGSFVMLTPARPAEPASPPVTLVLAHGDDPDEQRYPASTFKIPNTLIGLETGAISPEEVLRWDGQPRPIKDWERDLSLVEAFRASCVPCYQEVARRIGIDRMRDHLGRVGYGNGLIGDHVDTFWLEGPLAISVREEAELARRVYLEGDLPFRRENILLVKEAMKVEETPDYRLFAKTGWAAKADPNVGWYVGWVETAAGPRFFATRVLVPADQPKLMASVRKTITLEIMRDLGVIAK
ncbi:MAG: class D beta-lactamase [Deltaproteobacteria bacterium]|nr:class D beta-lactamase [Deltaproteobacteria bacterium]